MRKQKQREKKKLIKANIENEEKIKTDNFANEDSTKDSPLDSSSHIATKFNNSKERVPTRPTKRRYMKQISEESSDIATLVPEDVTTVEAHKIILGCEIPTSSDNKTRQKKRKQVRKKVYKEKNAIIQTLRDENAELKRSQDQHYAELIELHIEISEPEIEINKGKQRMNN